MTNADPATGDECPMPECLDPQLGRFIRQVVVPILMARIRAVRGESNGPSADGDALKPAA
jgi:hypothetical protein